MEERAKGGESCNTVPRWQRPLHAGNKAFRMVRCRESIIYLTQVRNPTTNRRRYFGAILDAICLALVDRTLCNCQFDDDGDEREKGGRECPHVSLRVYVPIKQRMFFDHYEI